MLLARDLIAALVGRKQSVSTAESLTGGLLCARLTGVPGSSAVVRGGLVAYETDVKNSVLGVDREILRSYGAVSEETAVAMAQAARRMFASTWALSTTGVAGPTSQENKPVGTVFVAVAGPVSATAALNLTGDREGIREQSCAAACTLLASCLE